MIAHGIAISKESIHDLEGNEIVEVGEQGAITAYLPDMETFAVMFNGEGRWFTFHETEAEFQERFIIQLEDDNKSDSSND